MTSLTAVLLLLLVLLSLAENGPADITQNRYIYIRKLGGGKYATEYAWGPSIKYTIAKQHVLANGQKMPLWAKLDTPQVGPLTCRSSEALSCLPSKAVSLVHCGVVCWQQKIRASITSYAQCT